MRFNCGPDSVEKHEAKKFWHRWFAWYPVRVSKRECIWLEFVERKGTFVTGFAAVGAYMYFEWEYKKLGSN